MPNVKGELIKNLRVAKGWTQETLAKKAGYEVRTIQRAEREGRAGLATISALAETLAVEIKDLLSLEKRKPDKQVHDDSYLVRVRDGSQLVKFVRGCHAFYFHGEESESPWETQTIAEFASWIEDADVLLDSPAMGAQVAPALTDIIQRLEQDDLWVFAKREAEAISKSFPDSGIPGDWTVAAIRVVRKTNPEIVQLDSSGLRIEMGEFEQNRGN